MTAVDPATVSARVAQLHTFRGHALQIHSMYHSPDGEKCFHIYDQDTAQDYKVRFAVDSNTLAAATEHRALTILAQHHLRWAAPIVEFDTTVPCCLVTGYYNGDSLDKSLSWVPHADRIVADLARMLCEVHSIRGTSFGQLASDEYPTWQSFLDVRFWRHVRPVAAAGYLTEDEVAMITKLSEQARDDVKTTQPVLLHFDVKPANILFDVQCSTTALVDWELARFGDIDFEWVKLQHLARRWPEYTSRIIEPLLRTVGFLPSDGNTSRAAKLLLYALYQACSLLAFKCQHGQSIPEDRFNDLKQLLHQVRQQQC